jgi:hypothetical protein
MMTALVDEAEPTRFSPPSLMRWGPTSPAGPDRYRTCVSTLTPLQLEPQ